MCTQCIFDRNLNSTQVETIPGVMHEIRQRMQSTKVLINYRKNQLVQAKQYFQRIQQGNRQIIQTKMKEHFVKLRQVMDNYEQHCE